MTHEELEQEVAKAINQALLDGMKAGSDAFEIQKAAAREAIRKTGEACADKIFEGCETDMPAALEMVNKLAATIQSLTQGNET